MALELGLQPSQIRQAIRNNLQDIGRPFRSIDNFIQQVLTQDQTSFPTDGYFITKLIIKLNSILNYIFKLRDSMTLEDILRREGPMNITNIAQYIGTTIDEEFSDSDESSENHE